MCRTRPHGLLPGRGRAAATVRSSGESHGQGASAADEHSRQPLQRRRAGVKGEFGAAFQQRAQGDPAFQAGQVHLRDVAFYLLVTWVALFATTRVLEARRWR